MINTHKCILCLSSLLIMVSQTEISQTFAAAPIIEDNDNDSADNKYTTDQLLTDLNNVIGRYYQFVQRSIENSGNLPRYGAARQSSLLQELGRTLQRIRILVESSEAFSGITRQQILSTINVMLRMAMFAYHFPYNAKNSKSQLPAIRVLKETCDNPKKRPFEILNGVVPENNPLFELTKEEDIVPYIEYKKYYTQNAVPFFRSTQQKIVSSLLFRRSEQLPRWAQWAAIHEFRIRQKNYQRKIKDVSMTFKKITQLEQKIQKATQKKEQTGLSELETQKLSADKKTLAKSQNELSVLTAELGEQMSEIDEEILDLYNIIPVLRNTNRKNTDDEVDALRQKHSAFIGTLNQEDQDKFDEIFYVFVKGRRLFQASKPLHSEPSIDNININEPNAMQYFKDIPDGLQYFCKLMTHLYTAINPRTVNDDVSDGGYYYPRLRDLQGLVFEIWNEIFEPNRSVIPEDIANDISYANQLAAQLNERVLYTPRSILTIIRCFSNALVILPKILATNAGAQELQIPKSIEEAMQFFKDLCFVYRKCKDSQIIPYWLFEGRWIDRYSGIVTGWIPQGTLDWVMIENARELARYLVQALQQINCIVNNVRFHTRDLMVPFTEDILDGTGGAALFSLPKLTWFDAANVINAEPLQGFYGMENFNAVINELKQIKNTGQLPRGHKNLMELGQETWSAVKNPDEIVKFNCGKIPDDFFDKYSDVKRDAQVTIKNNNVQVPFSMTVMDFVKELRYAFSSAKKTVRVDDAPRKVLNLAVTNEDVEVYLALVSFAKVVNKFGDTNKALLLSSAQTLLKVINPPKAPQQEPTSMKIKEDHNITRKKTFTQTTAPTGGPSDNKKSASHNNSSTVGPVPKTLPQTTAIKTKIGNSTNSTARSTSKTVNLPRAAAQPASGTKNASKPTSRPDAKSSVVHKTVNKANQPHKK